MRLINIEPVPNQSFTVNIGSHRYDIALKYPEDGFMLYDLYIDEDAVQLGQRVTQGMMFMPYRYQAVDGNFMLYIPEGEQPDYNQFGDSQLLYYLTSDEADSVGY